MGESSRMEPPSGSVRNVRCVHREGDRILRVVEVNGLVIGSL